MRRRAFLAIAGAMLVVACEALPIPIPVPGGVVVDGWVFPTPAPLPAGAVAIPIDTERPPAAVAGGVAFGCPDALHAPIRLVIDRSTDPPVIGYVTETGEPARLRWSFGISARAVDGVVEIVLPDGEIIVREDELSRVALGGGGSGDGVFHVCLTMPTPVGD
jgi:hypothetical protein